MIRPLLAFLLAPLAAFAQPVLTGPAAYGGWSTDAPGTRRLITPDALPAPYTTGSASRSPAVIAPPCGVMPKVPPSFAVSLFAEGLDMPRTLHGSWNRARRTGYKVVRIRFEKDRPAGEYEDFLTGFALSGRSVWGRPTGVTVTAGGALLVSEDGNGRVWRITHTGDRP